MQAVHTPSLSRSLKLGIVLCQESWAQCQIARKSSLVAIESLVYEPSYLCLLYNCGYLGSTSALPNHSQFCLAFVPTPVTTLLPEVSFSSWSLQLHPEKSQCSEFTQYVSDVWGPWYSTPKCKRSLVAHRGKKRFVIHEKVVQKCPISSKKKKTKHHQQLVICWAFETITQLPVFTNVLCAQLCPTPCDSMDCSPPGSSVHGIPQARILSGMPCPPPGDLPYPGIHSVSPALTQKQVGETTKQTDPRNNGQNGQGLRILRVWPLQSLRLTWPGSGSRRPQNWPAGSLCRAWRSRRRRALWCWALGPQPSSERAVRVGPQSPQLPDTRLLSLPAVWWERSGAHNSSLPN